MLDYDDGMCVGIFLSHALEYTENHGLNPLWHIKWIKQENKKYRRLNGRHSGDIDLSPLRNGFFIDNYKARKHTGHINFRFRFGNGGNINIHKGW